MLIHVDTIGFKFIARRCMLLIKTGPRNQYSSSFIGLAQAWALQEGNSIRALGSYVITRVSRTSTARQGNGRIVCLVIIYMCMNLMNRTEFFSCSNMRTSERRVLRLVLAILQWYFLICLYIFIFWVWGHYDYICSDYGKYHCKILHRLAVTLAYQFFDTYGFSLCESFSLVTFFLCHLFALVGLFQGQ